MDYASVATWLSHGVSLPLLRIYRMAQWLVRLLSMLCDRY